MDLMDIIHRSLFPKPWDEGENIPWDDPHISRRMLGEHLSQDHDSASRRLDKIEQHVAWIHANLLAGNPSRILDLACGPGLYTTRLALHGHRCMGIDYAPAAVTYAVNQCVKHDVECTYIHEDIRRADFGSGFDFAMLIYGEFNSFRADDAGYILGKIHGALRQEGLLLLEPHTFDGVRSLGLQDRSWYSRESGLFSPHPHICLEEASWDADEASTTLRYYVLDATSGSVERHAQTLQAYSDEDYRSLLNEHGFGDVLEYPSLTGKRDDSQKGLMALTARKLLS